MTPLQTELLRILTDERTYPPLSADSLQRVLHALGFSPLPPRPEIVQALTELMDGGWIECHHSAKLGPRYRVQRREKAATA